MGTFGEDDGLSQAMFRKCVSGIEALVWRLSAFAIDVNNSDSTDCGDNPDERVVFLLPFPSSFSKTGSSADIPLA